jgi:hypothetical protein
MDQSTVVMEIRQGRSNRQVQPAAPLLFVSDAWSSAGGTPRRRRISFAFRTASEPPVDYPGDPRRYRILY